MLSDRSGRSSGYTQISDASETASPGKRWFGWFSREKKNGRKLWSKTKNAFGAASSIQRAYRDHFNATRSCLREGGCIGEVKFSSTHNVAKIIILNTTDPDEYRTRNVVRLMDLQWQMLRPTVMYASSSNCPRR